MAPPIKYNISKEEMKDMLYNKRMSVNAIAKLYGTHGTTILKKCKKYGLKSLYESGRHQTKTPGKRIIQVHDGTGHYKRVEINECYIKEAKAILREKHWEGKNKCTKLPGD
jgi:hypothetical protein